jgi:hypothetical protein
MEDADGRSTIPFGYGFAAKPFGVNSARLSLISAWQMPKEIVRREPAHRHR